MILINLENVCLAFGLEPLLDKVKLQISSGERICLIGRNGAGKSSLLKIIEGVLKPDSGNVWRKPNLRLARLEQELPKEIEGSVYDFVAEGLAEVGALLKAYHALTQKLNNEQNNLTELERLQNLLEAKQGWMYGKQIETTLSRLDLNPDQRMSELSGGWQRRAALAKALVTSPELLLLDEPTNHLDIEAISWLEEELINCHVGLLFITHDRSLLKRLATRILELDRGQLTSWPGDYENFLRRKEERLHAEMLANKHFDKNLAKEEVWIRQGIKARRTRNEGRVRALKALRLERNKRRELEGKVNFDINLAEKSGQLVLEAINVSHSFNDQPIIKNFSIRILRKDRIGLIGPNGAGKSTLLNILLGKITPDLGSVKLGTNLEVAYFDQLRQKLDMEKTVFENVSEGSDFVEINGKKKHIVSYLGDFLFSAERAMTPVKALSGGECNRLLLARLFSLPANLLVLDEPTNDLDIETLELLEELLGNFSGTILIVSHDRTFLDNIVTSTLVFEGKGKIAEYIGGYQDWQKLAKQKTIEVTAIQKQKNEKLKTESLPRNDIQQVKKLSYKEQRELNVLPTEIENLENKKNALEKILSDPTFYQKDFKVQQESQDELKKLNLILEQKYQRWQELECKTL